METDLGAAAVVNVAKLLEAPLRNAAGEALPVELLVARDLDHQIVRQRVDHGNADAVQAAGGFIDLAVELAAGVQHRHDHLEGGLAGKLRMVFHRNAAAVVGDGKIAVRIEFDLDEVGVSGHGFVHRVVDDFGEQVVEGALVGAANIHARPATHRFEAFQDLDGGGIIGVTTGGSARFGGFRPGCFRRCSGGLSRCRVFRFWRGCCSRGASCGKKIVGIVHIAVMPDVDWGNESAGVCQNPFFQSTV